jgi:competence protein ComEC
VSLAAQAGTLPLIVNTFGVVSLVSPLANLVVVPLVSAATALGLLTVFVDGVAGPAATLLNGANWAVLKLAIASARLAAAPDWAQVAVPALPTSLAAAYALGLCLLLPAVRCGHHAGSVLIGGLVAANIWVWSGRLEGPRGLDVVVLDVGQGDAMFLEFPNGRTMLVDGGNRAPGVDAGRQVILPFLRSRGITHLDVLIASHPHSDHIGGLVSVLETTPVGHYLDSGQHHDSWTARRIRELLKDRGVAYAELAAGDSLAGLGGVGAVVLHPTAPFVSRSAGAPQGVNNGSVVLVLDYAGRRILLTGDVEGEADDALIRWGPRIQSDILKAAHHGSRTSSSQAFLEASRPEVVIVSCGEGNAFGHPSPGVLGRYLGLGIEVHRTDRHGAVVVRMDEAGIKVRRWLETGR